MLIELIKIRTTTKIIIKFQFELIVLIIKFIVRSTINAVNLLKSLLTNFVINIQALLLTKLF